jgi:hypothetical protein
VNKRSGTPKVVPMVSPQASYENEQNAFPKSLSFYGAHWSGSKELKFYSGGDLRGRTAAQRKSGFSSVSPEKIPKYMINLHQQFNRFSLISTDGKIT